MSEPTSMGSSPPRLIDGLRARVQRLEDNEVEFPIRLGVDETEEVIRMLWEFVGHMGDDVGTEGYEAHLLDRARRYAQQLQIAMLAAVAYEAPRLVAQIGDQRSSNEKSS